MNNDLKTLMKEIEQLKKENNKLNRAIKNQKFGLTWINIPEGFEKESEKKLPLLEEVPSNCIDLDSALEPNILIEGDNFHSLTCLNYSHKDDIDIIYIDPPYNTGGDDFYYKDKRVFDKYPDGKKVEKDDPARHSKWLSFMEKRLRLARGLLKRDGIIFISIGDDELANLKLLCNQIYGEKNFLGQVSRIQKKGSDLGDFFKPTVDYILAYAKNKNKLNKFKIGVDESKFKEVEIDGPRKGERFETSKSLYQSSLKDLRPNQKYPVECPDGTFVLPPFQVFDEIHREGEGRWRWSKDTYLEKRKDILVFKKTKSSPLYDQNGNKSEWNVYTKRYLEDAMKKGNVPSNIFEGFLNAEATKELSDLDISFSFPKPTSLIKQLIQITQKPNDIKILDFFAGSGSTGHAVLSLNNEDSGKRQFILCTNNENNICVDITLERIKRVIDPLRFLPSVKEKLDENKKIEDDIAQLSSELIELESDKLQKYLVNLKEKKKTYPKTKKIRQEKNLEEEYSKILADIKKTSNLLVSMQEKEKEVIIRNKEILKVIKSEQKRLNNTPKGINASLKYYKTKFSGSLLETLTDDDKVQVAQNAGELIALSENTLYEVYKTTYGQFFVNKTRTKIIGIYFDEDYARINNFKSELLKYSFNIDNIVTYVFSWGNEDHSALFDDMESKIETKSIPQPILEIYKKVYKV